MPINNASTPVAKIAGNNQPGRMTFDSAHRLFVANWLGGVQVFAPPIANGALPAFTLRVPFSPEDVKFDSAMNLFVGGVRLCSGASQVCGFISVFTAPITSTSVPNFTIPTGIHNWVTGIAFDSSGNLWASMGASLVEYTHPFSAGSVPALRLPVSPYYVPCLGLAFDSMGNIYTGCNGGLVVFKPPFTTSTSFTNPGAGAIPTDVAFDNAGNLYAANSNGHLLEFAPPFSSTSAPFVDIATGADGGIAIGP